MSQYEPSAGEVVATTLRDVGEFILDWLRGDATAPDYAVLVILVFAAAWWLL